MKTKAKVIYYQYNVDKELAFIIDGIWTTVYSNKVFDNKSNKGYIYGCMTTESTETEMRDKNLPMLVNESGVLFSEEQLFQMSTVWDNEISIELLIAIQKYFFSVKENSFLLKSEENIVLEY